VQSDSTGATGPQGIIRENSLRPRLLVDSSTPVQRAAVEYGLGIALPSSPTMPSTLTVVLNSNHSKRFVCLLLSLQAPKEAILREARNKFRTKALSQVYIQGGAQLEEAVDLREGTTTVWVSKGEPYSGPPSQNRRSDNPAEVRIIAEQSYVDKKAIKQLEQLADLPGVRLAVGMPDLHPGSRFPIGCAIAADGVYPALIGSDVGCGIALYQLAGPSRSHPTPSKLANLLRGLDEPWSGPVTDWLASYGIHRTSEFDSGSLGTVGAGNHFAELCRVERIVDRDAAERLGVHEDALYLLGTCRGKLEFSLCTERSQQSIRDPADWELLFFRRKRLQNQTHISHFLRPISLSIWLSTIMLCSGPLQIATSLLIALDNVFTIQITWKTSCALLDSKDLARLSMSRIILSRSTL
jgi:hypothetical protein